MHFLCWTLFPLCSFPGWLASLSTIDPLTYGVDALRRIALSGTVSSEVLNHVVKYPLWFDITVLLGFGVALLFPAVWLFNLKD
jgi:ABC-2 type transport system permease protein